MFLKTQLPRKPVAVSCPAPDHLDFGEAPGQWLDALSTLGLLLDRTLVVGREVVGLRRP